jgi:hypothetical protein
MDAEPGGKHSLALVDRHLGEVDTFAALAHLPKIVNGRDLSSAPDHSQGGIFVPLVLVEIAAA